MTNDRINDEVARLMDEAFEALRAKQWATVEARARAVIAFEPEHEEALRLLTAAARMLDDDVDPAAPVAASVPQPSPTTATAPPDGPATPTDELVTPVSDAAPAGSSRGPQIIRGAGRIALAFLRPLLAPVIIPLIVLVGGFVAADQGGLWELDGPLADTGLLDADGLLVRWRIAGDDRLVWKLPFVGPDEPGGTILGGAIAAGAQPGTLPPLRVPPQLEPPALYDIADVTLLISPFAEDSVLFGFATPDGMVVTVSGSRDAGGLPDRVESVAFRRGPVVSTMRFDGNGLVTRAEIFDESTGNGSALSFAYRGNTVTVTKHATAQDDRPVASIETPIDPAVAELIDVLREFAVAIPARRGTSTISISQRAEPVSIQMTADVVMGDEWEYIDGDQFDVEWELVIPGGYLNVAGDRVAWDFRSGPMRWDDSDGRYEASIPIWRPMSPSEVTKSCLYVQGEGIKTATALNIVGAILGSALSGPIAGEGKLAGWVVGDLIGLPFEKLAKLFAEVPTLPSSINLIQGEFLKAVSEGTISLEDGLATALNRLGTGDGTAKYLLADANWIRERLSDPSSAIGGLMKCHVIGQDRFDHETMRPWRVRATVTGSKRLFAGPTGSGVENDRRSGRHPDVGRASTYVDVGTSQGIRTAAELKVDTTIVVRDGFLEITLEDPDDENSYWLIDRRAPAFKVRTVTPGILTKVLEYAIGDGPGPYFGLLSDDRCELEPPDVAANSGEPVESAFGTVYCAFEEPGEYDVGIAITDSHGSKVDRWFTVSAVPALELTSVTPSVEVGIDNQTVIIRGQGFAPGSSTLVVIDAPFVGVEFVRFIDQTALVYNLNVSDLTPPGTYAVHINVGDEEATLLEGLRVVAASVEEPTPTPTAVAATPAPNVTPTPTATPAPTATTPTERFSIARYVDEKDYEYFFVHPTADAGALRRMDLRAMHGFCTGNTDTTPAPYTLVRGPFNSRAEAVAAFAAELTDGRTIGLGCYDMVSDLAGSNRGWVYLSGEIARALESR